MRVCRASVITSYQTLFLYDFASLFDVFCSVQRLIIAPFEFIDCLSTAKGSRY